MAIFEMIAPLQALFQIGSLLAAVDKAVRGVIFDSQPRYLAEYKLPLLWGTDVISSHHKMCIRDRFRALSAFQEGKRAVL